MVDAFAPELQIGINQGKLSERERILNLLADDETLHNIWWRIKREDTFPSQEFISNVIYDELGLGGFND